MKAVKTREGVYFDTPSPSKDIIPHLWYNFLRFREVRSTEGESRLYFLPDPTLTEYEDEDGAKGIRLLYPNLRLELVGEPTAVRTWEVLSQTVEDGNQNRAVYEQERKAWAIAAEKSEDDFPVFIKWWSKNWDAFRSYGYHVIPDKIELFTNDTDVYALAYADLRKIEDGPHIEWDNFLSQIVPEDGKEVTAAYIYSCIYAKNKMKSGLQMTDITGSTGKSPVIRAIDKCVPNIMVSVGKDTFVNQFGYSRIYGKPLLIYGDCKQASFWKSESTHSILGGDPVSIERKGEQPFTARVHAKIIVMSNNPPLIDLHNAHEKLRCIPITLDSRKCAKKDHILDGVAMVDNSWEDKLVSEFWHFMFYARECYNKLCVKDGSLRVPASLYEGVQSSLSDLFQDLYEDQFEVSPGSIIPRKDMENRLQSYIDKERYQKCGFSVYVSEWNKFLEGKNITYRYIDKKIGDKRIACKAYIGIKLKGDKSTVDLSDIDTNEPTTISLPSTKPVVKPIPKDIPSKEDEVLIDDTLIEEIEYDIS